MVLVVYFAGEAWWVTDQEYEGSIAASGVPNADSSLSTSDDDVDAKLPPRGFIVLGIIGFVFVLAACNDDR